MTDEQPTSRRAAREAAAPRARRSAPRAAPATADDAPRSGIGALFQRHRTAWLAGALAVAFVLAGSGAVFAGVAVGSAPEAVATPTAEPIPPRDRPETVAAASRLRTCSVADAASDPILMALRGYVARADTGEVLYSRGGSKPARTASVLKVLTAAAAVAVLGPDYRIRTSVFSGSTPGSIVLVGRGDATLSALPAGSESVYRGAPKLSDLAQQTLAKWTSTDPISSIVLDASYWSSADKWDASWDRSEQRIGYHSEVTALQVDGDRADPRQQTSPRSTDPISAAGRAFLAALRAADTEGKVAADVTLSTGSAITGQPLLAEVQSAKLRDLVSYMLLVSDNTLAEMLARITSKESGSNGSAASLTQSISGALGRLTGIDGQPLIPASGTVIQDGSGLSHLNAVSPEYVAKLMAAVYKGTQNLDVVKAGLPIAGKTGTLASRFTGDNAVARGQVVAKTGWITTAYSLGGYLVAEDGTVLVFAFYAIGEGISADARGSLDTLATAVFRCGDNLATS